VFLERLLDICPMDLDVSADSHGITSLRCLQEHLFTHRFSTSGDGDGFRVVLQMLATGDAGPFRKGEDGKSAWDVINSDTSRSLLARADFYKQVKEAYKSHPGFAER